MAKFGKTSSSIITLALGGVFFAFFEKELTWLMRYGNTFSSSKFSRCKHLTDQFFLLQEKKKLFPLLASSQILMKVFKVYLQLANIWFCLQFVTSNSTLFIKAMCNEPYTKPTMPLQTSWCKYV